MSNQGAVQTSVEKELKETNSLLTYLLQAHQMHSFLHWALSRLHVYVVVGQKDRQYGLWWSQVTVTVFKSHLKISFHLNL